MGQIKGQRFKEQVRFQADQSRWLDTGALLHWSKSQICSSIRLPSISTSSVSLREKLPMPEESPFSGLSFGISSFSLKETGAEKLRVEHCVDRPVDTQIDLGGQILEHSSTCFFCRSVFVALPGLCGVGWNPDVLFGSVTGSVHERRRHRCLEDLPNTAGFVRFATFEVVISLEPHATAVAHFHDYFLCRNRICDNHHRFLCEHLLQRDSLLGLLLPVRFLRQATSLVALQQRLEHRTLPPVGNTIRQEKPCAGY